MINDLLNSFEKYFKDNKVVVDTYMLQSGRYYLFSKNGKFLNYLKVDKDTDISTNIYNYFKVRDYYSNCINSNKVVDNKIIPKKICSNNYLTLFFKNCYVKGINGKYADKKEISLDKFEIGIADYYRSLAELGIKNKKEKEILESIKEYVVTNDEILNMKENMIKIFEETVNIIKKEIIENKDSVRKDCWIKIFIETDENEYKKASDKYLYLKIFNTNDYNIFKFNEIYGINNYNYGLNSKKSFLELKTTTYKKSFISQEKIKSIRNMYIWLLKIISPLNYAILPVNFDFKEEIKDIKNISNIDVYLLNVKNDKGSAVITDFEYIPNYNSNIRPFICKNYIDSKISEKNKSISINQNINNICDLQGFVSKIWFSGFLEESYFCYDEKVKKIKESEISDWKKRMLLKYNKAFKNTFLNQNPIFLKQQLNKIGQEVVKNYLKEQLPKSEKNLLNSTKKAMNLWIALADYFVEEVNMSDKIRESITNAKSIIKNKGQIRDDKTFYAVLGQVVYYLVSQTKSNGPTMEILDPILECNNINFLKKRLELLHKKYAYTISLYNMQYKNALSELLIYEPSKSEKENIDILLAAILSDNVFYQSKQENIDNTNKIK